VTELWICLRLSHIITFFSTQKFCVMGQKTYRKQQLRIQYDIMLNLTFHLTFCIPLKHISQRSLQACALILIRGELLSLDRMAAVDQPQPISIYQPSLKCISICRQQLECLRLQHHCRYVTTAGRRSIKY